MFRILIHWLVNATAVYVTANMLPGITISGFGTALMLALVLGLINALIRPVLVFFSIPFLIVTLGLFMLVINAFLLQFAALLVDGFAIQSFWWAMLGSLCISLVAWLLGAVLNI